MTEQAAPEPLSLVKEKPAIGSRALFPQLKPKSFLAHAAISPASLVVTETVQALTETVAQIGVGSFPIYNQQRERLRGKAATLLNVAPEHMALTGGCTRGITDLALALPWKVGDTLISYQGEFPANVNPWQVAAAPHGAKVELLDAPSPTDPNCVATIIQQLEARLARGDVPYVAISAVQFQTGLRMPMEQMSAVCRKHGARFFVDGIQACGVVPVDVKKCGADAFFTGAHKWLMSLEGTGFAYYSPELMKELRPVTSGWLSYPDSELFLFSGPDHLRYDRALYESPRVFEGSTVNAAGFAALEAGIDVLQAVGIEAVYAHVQKYHDALEPRLEKLGFKSLRATDPSLRSGSLALRPPAGVQVPALAAALRDEQVTISIPDGLVRIAPHFANSLDEVDLVVTAFERSLSSVV